MTSGSADRSDPTTIPAKVKESVRSPQKDAIIPPGPWGPSKTIYAKPRAVGGNTSGKTITGYRLTCESLRTRQPPSKGHSNREKDPGRYAGELDRERNRLRNLSPNDIHVRQLTAGRRSPYRDSDLLYAGLTWLCGANPVLVGPQVVATAKFTRTLSARKSSIAILIDNPGGESASIDLTTVASLLSSAILVPLANHEVSILNVRGLRVRADATLERTSRRSVRVLALLFLSRQRQPHNKASDFFA
ncbi:hypothetical protein [Bradyrhizobium sp. Gha]|uniref:hypothetical protein n=1 Tax=Bradyrhizobium sp. Gha TaxID=1855318 RepID=UPI0008EBF36E|nr:hypothetical protein [Bradyrhizobium sp. Gha]SFK09132.1 hypothetical protein SAMN05216525_1523 [Bradyrhizobium sp. Gha]